MRGKKYGKRKKKKKKQRTEGRWRAGAKDGGDERKVAQWSRGAAGIGEWTAPIAQSAKQNSVLRERGWEKKK